MYEYGKHIEGPVIIYGENVFLDKNFADPKIQKIPPNLKYQLKNKYTPLAKNICPLPLL
jgi:nucleoid-associated protein YejK